MAIAVSGDAALVLYGHVEHAGGRHRTVRSTAAPVPRRSRHRRFHRRSASARRGIGSAALVVRFSSPAQVIDVLRAIAGSLTLTLWGVSAGSTAPDAATQALVHVAAQVAGRVLFAGVAVTAA